MQYCVDLMIPRLSASSPSAPKRENRYGECVGAGARIYRKQATKAT